MIVEAELVSARCADPATWASLEADERPRPARLFGLGCHDAVGGFLTTLLLAVGRLSVGRAGQYAPLDSPKVLSEALKRRDSESSLLVGQDQRAAENSSGQCP